MKKLTACLTLVLLITFTPVEAVSAHSFRANPHLMGSGDGRAQAPPQSASSPRWQSREEYEVYNETLKQSDPEAKIALAQAFIQRFPGSDFKAGAYLIEMQCYQRLGRTGSAVVAARNVLKFERDNLEALAFLCYVFPSTVRADDSQADVILARAEIDAHHGLDVLQSLPKPDNVSDEQFRAFVNSQRAIFNDALGFIALYRKDYHGAVRALRGAVADNPHDAFAFYRMGLAYLYSTPADYHHGIWYVARAAALARDSHDPSSQEFLSFLRRVFVGVYGNRAGLEETLALAQANPEPPNGPGRAGPHRPRPFPGQGTSTGGANKPSGLVSAPQNNSPTSYLLVEVIYPSWLPPPEEEGGNPVPVPSPADIDAQIANRINDLIDFRNQQQPWQEAGPPPPPEPSEPEPAAPMTVLVYKDGHKVEVQTYAIMGKNLVWFSGELSKKIPLAELDLVATRKVNEDHGVTFAGPNEP